MTTDSKVIPLKPKDKAEGEQPAQQEPGFDWDAFNKDAQARKDNEKKEREKRNKNIVRNNRLGKKT